MATMTYTDTLTILDCGKCHVSFAIPQNLHRKLMRTGDWFWCPNGCRIHYYDDENTRLRASVARLEGRVAEERQRAEAERRSKIALKGVVTKARKRQAAGVCPVPGCKRTVRQLADHMATKHADFVIEAAS